MNALKDLEREVYQFLSTLAGVRSVTVAATVNSRGKKGVATTTTVVGPEAMMRVNVAESHLMDRHENVAFDFSYIRLKETDEQRTLGTT